MPFIQPGPRTSLRMIRWQTQVLREEPGERACSILLSVCSSIVGLMPGCFEETLSRSDHVCWNKTSSGIPFGRVESNMGDLHRIHFSVKCRKRMVVFVRRQSALVPFVLGKASMWYVADITIRHTEMTLGQ